MKKCPEESRSGNQSYTKASRILKRIDFVRLSRHNRKVNNKHFVALYHKGNNRQTRLGITVTKKVGKAVARNKLRRYVREFFRRNRHLIQNGIDLNIIVKTQASGIPSKEAFQSLENIFRKIREKD
jgi:ribonuclease P protein component